MSPHAYYWTRDKIGRLAFLTGKTMSYLGLRLCSFSGSWDAHTDTLRDKT